MVTRRFVLSGAAAGTVAALASLAWCKPLRASTGFAVHFTDAQWRMRLAPARYAVLREAATEPPFSSPLLQESRRGDYACAGCALDLYSSTTKFHSGTGWPSFWAPLPHAIGTLEDRSLGMDRTAVFCSRCGGHLGHVFPDGPPPTGLRYCMNGLALVFKPLPA
ncbi:MAG TPA: peptide-methionine (R)-S-oxide reductase MsrB [Steroidobacteraceae bacterium]|jgi:peptide-methionine (R)-S-oxide reductase|nr:peptide-methionine (R)-S-oxide reductase MsrB [Steroidobacteraceae bacterium]